MRVNTYSENYIRNQRIQSSGQSKGLVGASTLRWSLILLVALCILHRTAVAAPNPLGVDDIGLFLPFEGDDTLHILSPTVLDVVMMNSMPPGGPVDSWNFVSGSGVLTLPAASEFSVTINGVAASVVSEGFKRRPLYAPLATRDLRIENHLYLVINTPVNPGQTVTVTNPDNTLWPTTAVFTAVADPMRYNPFIHVNQEGYTSNLPKKAMVGGYLGSMGEMPISAGTSFSIIDLSSSNTVFTGTLSLRADSGFIISPIPYQQVYQADFSSFTTPGDYELVVPGMGGSLPFTIDNSLVMGFTRAYELGLYNQRCGMNIGLPYTRFSHPACHTAPAFIPIPDTSFPNAWTDLQSDNGTYPNDPRETAPRLVSQATQLYPFVNTGTVDVSGGHHDAGDYSKYITDSAQLVHYLCFAVDNFPGAGALDNLGIPESGDGLSDLLQEAKYEADFIAKMQDADGGFYFLVYPENRKYESNVLPQNGDPQVVFPKNTSGTAAAVAALAEMASSPLFKAQFPAAAASYMSKAQAGWNFLMNAIATYGKNGAYQQITPYGDVFMHDDELAWAACEMYVATGNPVYQTQLEAWYNPSDPATLRWTWWRLFEGYGAAARDYAFAVQSGRLQSSQIDPNYLALCNTQIIDAGNDALSRSQQCAYGSAFDSESKRCLTAGWFFSSDRAFDMTVANLLSPNPAYVDAIMTNMNYEGGCNPANVTLITGLGTKRQRDIVNQYAQNDTRVLPPSGIQIGNIITGFAWLNPYGSDLGNAVFPSDGLTSGPFQFYDRWGDSYNTTAEATIVNAARSLASLSYFAAQTPAATVPWTPVACTITAPSGFTTVNTPVTVSLNAPGMNLTGARVVWEANGLQPAFSGSNWTLTPNTVGPQWVEAEAEWPDGRRVAAAGTFSTQSATGRSPFTVDANTVALYHFDGNYADSGTNGFTMTPAGNATLATDNSGWMTSPSGSVVRCAALGDQVSVSIPAATIFPGKKATPITVEAMIYPRAYKAYSYGNYAVIQLYENYDACLQILDGKWDSPPNPFMYGGASTIVTATQWANAVSIGTWHYVKMTLATTGVVACSVDGTLVSSGTVSNFNYSRTTPWTLSIGNLNGDIDELRVSNILR
jgi:hypothetical protein